MDNIKETAKENKKKSKKTLTKAVAVAVSTGLLAVGAVAALDNIQSSGSSVTHISDPDPVVLDIEDIDMAEDADETDEDEQGEKKRGVLGWLKIWFYGMITGIVGFIATKIPWKKIFTKRNLIILLVVIVLFLGARYILPYFLEVPWGPDPIFGTGSNATDAV